MPLLLLLVFLAAGPAFAQAQPAERDATAELAPLFPEGAEGAFVLYDAATDTLTRYRPERTRLGLLPASTFKIFNALVILDAGVVEDEHEVIAWDGVDRGSDGWNASQGLATALQRSSVWVFQELARRVGPERMQAALTREGYGNATMGGPIDQFWLDGGLRITPEEQVAFLRRLYDGDLGFSERAMAAVKRMMLVEEGEGYAIHAKTGWARPEGAAGPQIGWWVGWVEREEGPAFFAISFESVGDAFDMGPQRRATAERVLRHLGVLPPLADSGAGR